MLQIRRPTPDAADEGHSRSNHLSPQLVCVPPDKLISIWGRVEGLLQFAYENDGDESFNSLKGDLFGNCALLWLVIESDQIVGAIATSIFATQKGKKLCRIRACAGRDFGRWKHLISEIEAFAKAEGCTHSRIEGRLGWKKMFPEYKEPYVILERRL